MLLESLLICCCLIGSPRVENDEEEDDIDDLDNEFEYENGGVGFDQVSEGMSVSRRHSGFPQSDLDSAPPGSQIPLLTYGDEVISLLHCSHIFSLSLTFWLFVNNHRTLRFLLTDMLSSFLLQLVVTAIKVTQLLSLTQPLLVLYLMSRKM